MCGIAGIIGEPDEQVLSGMLSRIHHRGPDSCGSTSFQSGSIGNKRLSIIDIRGGDQPINSTGSQPCTVVLNGELYGYKERRNNCSLTGYIFKTDSDTEVLLPLYQQYGLDLFSHLNGMFCFCLYDHTRECYLIGRDHMGIKPLVFTTCHGRLYFSSEIKSFFAIPGWSAAPDLQAWHNFLNIRFPPSPSTLFEGVRKLPAGSYMIIGKKEKWPVIPPCHKQIESFNVQDFTVAIYCYYTPQPKKQLLTMNEALEKGPHIFQKSVRNQMVADVPVGVYLSGGIDSTTVSAFASEMGARKIHTFCLGFNEPTDENDDANIIATHFHTDHTDLILDEKPLRYFREAIYHMEEPKVNCIQGYLLAKTAVQYQKVVLSGLGGDELFGGYDIYEIGCILDILHKPVLGSISSLSGEMIQWLLKSSNALGTDLLKRKAALLSRIKSPLEMYILLRNGWDHDSSLIHSIYSPSIRKQHFTPLKETLQHSFPESDSIAEAFMLFELRNKMVDDFLANDDRMSSAHSLEVRVPFLDRDIVDFALSLPVEHKIRIGKRKIFLKELLKRHIPPSILQKKKQGFTFNPVLQAKKDLQPLAAKCLTQKKVEETGLFNYNYIRQILAAPPHNNLRWHYFLLWKILGYHIWHDIFIKNQGTLPN